MNEQRDQRDQEQRGWRQGFSKRHKIRCSLCGNLEHERGKHFRPELVEPLKRKLEREQSVKTQAVAAD